MVSYSRILVAVPYGKANDGTLQRAVDMARSHNAQLTLFGVTEEIEKEYESWLTTKLPEDLEQAMQAKQSAALQAQADALRADYAAVDSVVAKGIPFIELIKQVQSGGHDLLILDAVSSQANHKRFMGSTTKHVLRKCPCAVLCVRGNKKTAKVLAAVDVFAHKPESQALNLKVLAHAHAMAQQEQAELHVVYAQQPIGEPMLSSWGIGSADMLDGMEADLIANSQSKLLQLTESVCGSAEGVVMKTILGNPRDALPVYVKDQGIDLMAMGTVCRTGIKGFLIGNTAESILSEVECSILALKPDGFVSTVS